MTQLIVARFNDQFAATAAVSKLLANGVGRDQMSVEVHARFMDTPVGTPAPTHPIPREAPRENTTHRGRTSDDAISPRFGARPEAFGHCVVTVAVGAAMDANQLRRVFDGDGANSVEARDGELPPDIKREHRGTTKVGYSVTEIDRQRAIDASRGGTALTDSLNKSQGEAPGVSPARGSIDALTKVRKSPAQQADDRQILPDEAS